MQNVNVYCLIFYLQKVNLHFAVFNIFFWLEMSALKNTILQLCIYDFIFTIKF